MRKQTLRRLARFMRRAGIGLLFAVVAILAPCPVWTPEIFTWWQVPIVVLTLILYLGVVLFDTLFFDRYH
ncbi:MAG: hypothetical protein H7175_20645 [Burkholderiales bacterium]|nr:hypothetical protein [Anaerolineae bacterium]